MTENVIFDFTMSGECRAVGEDIVVADFAVVRDVRADHQKVARADARRFTFAAGAMYRHALAY
jgi:hypothetical protein